MSERENNDHVTFNGLSLNEIFLKFYQLQNFPRNIIVIFNFIILVVSPLVSQNCIIEMVVVDTFSKEPLDFVGVSIRIPGKETIEVHFTDLNGRLKIDQKQGMEVHYGFSYLGYFEKNISVECDKIVNLNIKVELKQSAFEFEEVVIKENFPKMIVKKDTVIYSVSDYLSGNEEKLKEVLNKLPGINVDRNNIVTYQGERVADLLVENEKFFTGDPSFAAKYIPANIVHRVEVLEKYNPIAALQNTSMNEKLIINIKLKPDKKKIVFGETECGTNLTDRHVINNKLFYFNPVFTANNIFDFRTTQDMAISQSELFRILGPEIENFDPKLKASNFKQYFRIYNLLNSSNFYDQKTLFDILQFRGKTKQKLTLQAILFGFNRKSLSSTEKVVTFPDRQNGNQFSTSNINFDNRHRHANVSLNTDPEKNYFISYLFRYTSSNSIDSDTSFNTFGGSTNSLLHTDRSKLLNYEHIAKYIHNWHEKVQSVLMYNRSYSSQFNNNIWNVKGVLIPELYNTFDENITVTDNKQLPDRQTSLLFTVNYNTNHNSRFHFFAKNEKINSHNNITVQSRRNVTGEVHPFLTVDQLTGNPNFVMNSFISGMRYIYEDRIKEIRLGMDYQDILYNVANYNTSYNFNRISPYLDLSKNINRIGRIGLSYQFEFLLPSLVHLNPFYIINQFNSFTLGDYNISPEQRHSVSLNLRKSNGFKDLFHTLSISYSIIHNPIISGYVLKGQSFVQEFYNSDRLKNDLTLHFIHNKTINRLKIFNHIFGIYSGYYQRIQLSETQFNQYSLLHKLQLTRVMDDAEFEINLSNSIRNVPARNQISNWIYQPEIQVDLKYYLGKKWSFTLNGFFNALRSDGLNQSVVSLMSKVQFMSSNEKIKINLICHNILNQKYIASNQVDIFSATVINHRLFPRQIFATLTYIY